VPLNFQRGLAEAENAVVAARAAARVAAADATHRCKLAHKELEHAQAALPSQQHSAHHHHHSPPPRPPRDAPYLQHPHARAAPRERPGTTPLEVDDAQQQQQQRQDQQLPDAALPSAGSSASTAAPQIALAQQGVVQANATSALARAHLACFSVARYREEAARCDALRAADLRDFMVSLAFRQFILTSKAYANIFLFLLTNTRSSFFSSALFIVFFSRSPFIFVFLCNVVVLMCCMGAARLITILQNEKKITYAKGQRDHAHDLQRHFG